MHTPRERGGMAWYGMGLRVKKIQISSKPQLYGARNNMAAPEEPNVLSEYRLQPPEAR